MAVDETPRPHPRFARDGADLVRQLNELRLWAGQPSLRTLRRLAGETTTSTGAVSDALPVSTASYLLNGRGLPRLPRMELVEAFVAACLAARGEPSEEIRSEVDRWRTAWRRIAAGPAQVDVQPVAVPEQSPAPVGHNQGGRPAPGRWAGWRPGWPVTAGVALAAAGLAVTVTLLVAGGESDEADRTGPPETASPVRSATELFRGTVPKLTDTDGIDLDTGKVGSQKVEGIDLSPWGKGNHVVSQADALMELLEEPGEISYQRCARVPARDLTDQVRGLYDARPGAALCVWTREGRVAMLVLTRTSSQRTGALAFDYVIWQPE